MPNPKSKASIAGHPIHPMIVPFPIAFFIGALACDLAYLKTVNLSWFVGAEFLLGAGLVMAALAAVAGMTDFASESRIRNLGVAWFHAGGNIIIVLLEAYNLYMRYTGGPVTMDTGLVLSVVSVVLLLGTGWLGGEMVYRYGVGVSDRPADRLISRRLDIKEDGHFPYPQDRNSQTENRPH
jgi:uncharacterized membrane protein